MAGHSYLYMLMLNNLCMISCDIYICNYHHSRFVVTLPQLTAQLFNFIHNWKFCSFLEFFFFFEGVLVKYIAKYMWIVKAFFFLIVFIKKLVEPYAVEYTTNIYVHVKKKKYQSERTQFITNENSLTMSIFIYTYLYTLLF